MARSSIHGSAKRTTHRRAANAGASSRPSDTVRGARGVPTERALAKSVEAQIVEWADDVAYSIHDVEDWYRARFMPLELLVESTEAREALAARIAPDVADENFDRGAAEAEVKAFFKGPAFAGIKVGYDSSAGAKKGLRAMRSFLFDEFIGKVTLDKPDAPATRHNNDLVIDPYARFHSAILRSFSTSMCSPTLGWRPTRLGKPMSSTNSSEFVTALHFNPTTQRFGKGRSSGSSPLTLRTLHGSNEPARAASGRRRSSPA